MKAHEINAGDVGEFGFIGSSDRAPAVVVDRTGSNMVIRYIDSDNRWHLALVDVDTLCGDDEQEFIPDIPEIYVTATAHEGITNSSRNLRYAMQIGIDNRVAHITSFTVPEGQ